jgi:fibronectin type 3 domain-containing protein
MKCEIKLANPEKESYMKVRFVEYLRERAGVAIGLLCVLTIGAVTAGCGSGSSGGSSSAGTGPSTGVSSQTVRGVAATGSPLVGQVTLRDSSSARRDKVTVIANDGSFSIDVSDMQAPFLLKATGKADGASHTLYSFADQPGTANINPLSNAALANAAGVDDPSVVFDKPDSATLEKIRSGMPGSVAILQTQLLPLLNVFSAGTRNPVRDTFVADHDGLDGMFDSVRIVLSNGILTITNVTSGAVIFSARVKDLEHGHFSGNSDHLPKRGPRLAAPTGVQAVGGDGQVTISWNPVPNATSYDLFYVNRSHVGAKEKDDDDEHENEDEDEDGKWLKNVTSPFVLTGLAANTTYSFMVRARDNPRKGRPSAKVSATTTGATTPPTLPAAPTGVGATGGTNQVTISWPAVIGATSYNLYWSGTTGVTTTNGTKVIGVSSPAVLTGRADSTTYYFIVTAVNGAGEGAASVQVAATTLAAAPPPTTAPAAPTGISAAAGTDQVTVSWSAATGATSYNVYWSAASGVTATTGTLIAGVTSPFVHTGRTASTAYFYIVTAVNSVGESGASVEATATTTAPPLAVPSAPGGVTAVGGTRQVTVTWNAVSGATSYNLYWSTTLGVTVATGTKITGVTSSYQHTGRADGTAYFYIATAVNSVGESIASSQATATTNAAPPPPIDGVALYNQYCSGCHNSLPGDFQGASATMITNGIANNRGGMGTRFNATNGTLIKLTPEQINAISAAMQ